MIGHCRAGLMLGFALVAASQGLSASGARVQVAPSPPWVDSVEKPDFAAPISADAKQGFDVLLSEDQFSVEDQARYTHLVYRITSALGVQNGSNVTVTYDPEYESIDFHRLCIVRDGQVIDRLDLSKIKCIQQEKDLERYQYNGQLTALIILDDIRVGDVIDYSYTRTGLNPIMAGHFCSASQITQAFPIHRLRIRLLLDKAHPVFFKVMGNGKPTLDRSLNKDQVEYDWHADKIPPVHPDDDLPASFEPYSYIEFSDFPDWRQVAEWAQPLYKLPDPLPASIADKALKVTDRSITEEQKVLAVLHFVQEDIRYLGIEIGVHSHRPNPPDLVLDRRYGDCKDKVILFCAMLKSLGVTAYPALTHSYRHDAIASHEPTPSAFNHVIAKVEAEGIEYWVDPTLSNQDGDLPHRSIPEYTWALPIRERVDSLTALTASKDARPTIFVHEDYTLDDIGKPASLVVQVTYCGSWADYMRGHLRHTTVEQVAKESLNYRSRLYPRIRVVIPPSWDDSSNDNTIKVKTTYAIDDMWQTPGGTKLKRTEFYPMAMRDYIVAPASPNRSMPMYLPYPLDIRYEADITSPWAVNVAINDRNISLENYFTGTARYHGLKNTTFLNYTLSHGADQIPASKVAEYSDDLRDFRQAVDYTITIDPEAIERGKHFRLSWTFTGLLSLAIAVSTFGAWLIFRTTRVGPPPLVAATHPELSGLGGWLILVGIGIIIRPLVLIYKFIKVYPSMFDGRVWDAMSDPTGVLYKPALTPVVIAEVFSNVALIIMNLLMVFLFFKRRRTYPMTFIVFLAATLIVLIGDHMLVVGVLHSSTASSSAQAVRLILQAAVAAAIWIPYMIVSRRVKATFVN